MNVHLTALLIAVCNFSAHAGDIIPRQAVFDLAGPQIFGEHVRRAGTDAICRIRIYNKYNVFKEICTGTLTSKNEVHSAAHCYNEIKPTDVVMVGCGFRGLKRKSQDEGKFQISDVPEAEFKEEFQVKEIRIAAHYSPKTDANDVAVLKLSKESGLTPMAIMEEHDVENLFEEGKLKSSVECRVSGYGINSQGFVGDLRWFILNSRLEHIRKGRTDTRFRTAYEAPLHSWVDSLICAKTIEFRQWDMFLRLIEVASEKETHFPAGIGPGDSGGPLHCRTSPDSPWQLVGVTSNIQFALDSQGKDAAGKPLTAISELIEWSSPRVEPMKKKWRATPL